MVHPLASVIVTVYIPSDLPIISCVVSPSVHKYEKGAVPPDTVKSTDPSDPPKQFTSVAITEGIIPAAG